MKVFVTGHRGYVGAHLVDLLKQAGHQVTGCDLNLFDGCAWQELVQPDREMVRDVRMLTPRDLEGYDCVMHLAAISNDPMGDLDPEITRDINARGSITLARAAKAAAVPRFFFSSSCSIYGKADGRPLAEEDALNPVSVYAESKIVAEGNICIMSDGTPWRPLIHCKDIARAFMAFLIAPRAEIHNQAVNIGSDA